MYECFLSDLQNWYMVWYNVRCSLKNIVCEISGKEEWLGHSTTDAVPPWPLLASITAYPTRITASVTVISQACMSWNRTHCPLASERHNFINIKIEMGIPQQEAHQYSTWELKQRLQGYFQCGHRYRQTSRSWCVALRSCFDVCCQFKKRKILISRKCWNMNWLLYPIPPPSIFDDDGTMR